MALEGPSLPSPKLEYPLVRPARIAVLGLTVQPESGIHVFSEWNSSVLNKYRPCALAGWLPDLMQAGRLRESGLLAAAELTYPLLVFSTPEQGPLDEAAHAALWRWFGLPVYEQIRTAEGRLVAVECETRNGFHLAGEYAANNDELRCDCGHGQRWVPAVTSSSVPAGRPECGRPLATAAGD
jgi:hypothetical protein